MQITIDNTVVTLKQTFRSAIIFETITDKPFQIKGVNDTLLFFYCTVMASDPTLTLEYKDFLTWLDDNPKELVNFTNWLRDSDDTQKTLSKPVEGEIPADESKKKE